MCHWLGIGKNLSPVRWGRRGGRPSDDPTNRGHVPSDKYSKSVERVNLEIAAGGRYARFINVAPLQQNKLRARINKLILSKQASFVSLLSVE